MELKSLIEYMKNNNIFQLIISSEKEIFYRANLQTLPLKSPNLSKEEVETMLHSIITKEKYEVFLRNKKLVELVKFGDERLIIKAFINSNSLFFTITILRSVLPNLEKLNLPKITKRIFNLTKGLIFISSEYDNAQRDIFSALINYANTNFNKYLTTIERPIYYHHKNLKSFVNQQEFLEDSEISTRMQNVILENPDIICFAEIYNKETAKFILDYSRNKLVIVNITANSVITCLENFLNFFDFLEKEEILLKLSENLASIICQAFAKKLDATGLVPVFEFMYNNKLIANIIKENKISQILSHMNNSQYMRTMENSLKELTEKEIIDSECYKNALAMKEDDFWLNEKKTESF